MRKIAEGFYQVRYFHQGFVEKAELAWMLGHLCLYSHSDQDDTLEEIKSLRTEISESRKVRGTRKSRAVKASRQPRSDDGRRHVAEDYVVPAEGKRQPAHTLPTDPPDPLNTGVTKPEPTIVIEEVSEDKEEKIRQTDQAEDSLEDLHAVRKQANWTVIEAAVSPQDCPSSSKSESSYCCANTPVLSSYLLPGAGFINRLPAGYGEKYR
ncbi:unnamed protein product [Heligmosomoides polygyrus]|uniref:Uncharacterized protein n=1 Tax=Heligmosomoides polygyrus TaxID=6339 RepID=A0A183FXP5_HELPZ|nr:unnamed protein product [Heligmosomoides polygyrus]